MAVAPLRLTTTIQAADAGLTLLDFLASRFRYHDRSTWEAKIGAHAIRIDGQPATPWTRLRRGMLLSYDAVHREPDVDVRFSVLHETPSLLFVDKPAGLPVHADGVFVRHTLVHVLRARYGPHVQPTHRLDRETSGVLVAAKDKAAAKVTQMQFQRGEVAKTYLAIVRGVVADDTLTITAPLGRDRRSSISIRRTAVDLGADDARAATTAVRVRLRLRTSTLVEVTPHSGRTHQIRAHLTSVGHSLVGDVLYGRDDDAYLAWVQHVKAGGDAGWPQGRDAPRHFLHAHTLTLTAPEGDRLEVSAPLPADMQAWVERERRPP